MFSTENKFFINTYKLTWSVKKYENENEQNHNILERVIIITEKILSHLPSYALKIIFSILSFIFKNRRK